MIEDEINFYRTIRDLIIAMCFVLLLLAYLTLT